MSFDPVCGWLVFVLGAALAVSLIWNVNQAVEVDRQDAEIEHLKHVVKTLREYTSFHHGDVVSMEWRRRKGDWEK